LQAICTYRHATSLRAARSEAGAAVVHSGVAEIRAAAAAADFQYGSRNVLADPAIREGIKGFTGWPTIPQVGALCVYAAVSVCMSACFLLTWHQGLHRLAHHPTGWASNSSVVVRPVSLYCACCAWPVLDRAVAACQLLIDMHTSARSSRSFRGWPDITQVHVLCTHPSSQKSAGYTGLYSIYVAMCSPAGTHSLLGVHVLLRQQCMH
jgi:hypothetical protein